MRMCERVFTITAALVLAGAGSAAAQEPATRRGFRLGFGLGYGSAGVSCDACDPGRESGITAHVRLGWTLNPRLLLGGELTGFLRGSQGVTTTLVNISLVAQYYPKAEGRFFVKGGAGFSAIEFDEDKGNVGSGESFGLVAGVGYDIPVGHRLPPFRSITPMIDVAYGAPRDIELGSTTFGGVSTNYVSVGFGLTFD